MTTNPGNIVRVRARNGGRASVLEANAWCQMLNTGLLEGYGVTQNTIADMNVLVGGTPDKPDVVIAQTPSGYKIALDIVGRQPIQLTAPGSSKRYTAIVAYTDDLSLSTEETNITGSPSTCGLIAVNGQGTQPPTDSNIRSAITADGAAGTQAAYAVIATVEIGYQTSTITDSIITTTKAGVMSENVDWTTSAALPPAEFSGNRASNSSSYQDMTGTYTIPEDGLYELYTHVSSVNASGKSFLMAIKAFLGQDELFERTGIGSVANYAGNNFANIDVTISFYAKRNDVIKLQSKVDNWTGQINHKSRIKRLV